MSSSFWSNPSMVIWSNKLLYTPLLASFLSFHCCWGTPAQIFLQIFCYTNIPALKRLKAVCDAGFISVLDFWNNPLKVMAAHELGIVDPSMGTKMTVQVTTSVQLPLPSLLSLLPLQRWHENGWLDDWLRQLANKKLVCLASCPIVNWVSLVNKSSFKTYLSEGSWGSHEHQMIAQVLAPHSW